MVKWYYGHIPLLRGLQHVFNSKINKKKILFVVLVRFCFLNWERKITPSNKISLLNRHLRVKYLQSLCPPIFRQENFYKRRIMCKENERETRIKTEVFPYTVQVFVAVRFTTLFLFFSFYITTNKQKKRLLIPSTSQETKQNGFSLSCFLLWRSRLIPLTCVRLRIPPQLRSQQLETQTLLCK